MAWAWTVEMVCREFGCLPRAAVAELAQDPEQLAVQIIDLRRYAAAKRLVEAAKTDADLPGGNVMIPRVKASLARILRGDTGG